LRLNEVSQDEAEVNSNEGEDTNELDQGIAEEILNNLLEI